MDEPRAARMRPFSETIFAEMSRIAVETGAVNLGQGSPDTDGPRSLLNGAVRCIEDGVNQYPPGPGRPELRAAVAAVPAQVRYDNQDEGRHLVRFAFCKRGEVLDEAVDRLTRAFAN